MSGTHIVAAAGGPALCGQRDPLPYVGATSAASHRYPQPRCEACYRAAGLAWMLEPPYVPTSDAPASLFDVVGLP